MKLIVVRVSEVISEEKSVGIVNLENAQTKITQSQSTPEDLIARLKKFCRARNRSRPVPKKFSLREARVRVGVK